MIQHAVYETYTKANLTKESLPGKTLLDEGIQIDEIIQEINSKKSTEEEQIQKKGNEEDYYLLEQNELEEIGVENSKSTYIVNYKTGEVINNTKLVTKTGKPLYTYSKEEN